MSDSRIVCLDVETGGLEPADHQIIQVACIAVEWAPGLRELDRMEVKLQLVPGKFEDEALEGNCYDPEVWERDAVPSADALRMVSAFFREHATWERISKRGKPYRIAKLMAHNAPFDCSFIEAWFGRSGKFIPAGTKTSMLFCTMAFAQTFAMLQGEDFGKYRLEWLCQHFEIPLDNAHDAEADVQATVELARLLTDAMGWKMEAP